MNGLNSVENALKSVYLGVIQNQLNTDIDPVLSKIKQTTSDVWGKEIIKNVYINGKTLNFKEELKNLYVSIGIADKAIRCAENNAGAFVNLLNNEIENMLNQTQSAIKNSFYTEDIKPDYLPNELRYFPIELTGLKKIFDIESEELYGLKRTRYKELNPIVEKLEKFDPIKIQEIIDNNNDEINVIICSSKVKRDYMSYLTEHRQNIEVEECAGCHKCILFNNSILMCAEKIPDNEIYLLNTEDFKLHQLCDWRWLEDESGKILKQYGNMPIYKATLVKYANYICEKPYKQIKIVLGV